MPRSDDPYNPGSTSAYDFLATKFHDTKMTPIGEKPPEEPNTLRAQYVHFRVAPGLFVLKPIGTSGAEPWPEYHWREMFAHDVWRVHAMPTGGMLYPNELGLTVGSVVKVRPGSVAIVWKPGGPNGNQVDFGVCRPSDIYLLISEG